MEAMIRSYAKINIGLKVLEKRADGYHDIDSYFHLIDLYDEIYPQLEKSAETKVEIAGNEGYLDKGRDIMEKAALAFSEKSGITFSLKIRIRKNIPSKAGLGGGSSNGAAILKYLNTQFSNPLSSSELIALSLSVGSDLPFFVSGFSAARVRGRGEMVEEVSPLDLPVDLFIPSFSVDTSEAYYKLDTLDRSFSSLPDSLTPLSNECFPNDFELAIARSPLIQSISESYGYFSLSGSGSTYFGLNKKDSKELAESGIIHTISTLLI